jgi:hypothetical protein
MTTIPTPERTTDPHPFADRLVLSAWAERKLGRAPARCRRFVRAIADMPEDERTRFLSVALLYGGDLKKILPEVAE